MQYRFANISRFLLIRRAWIIAGFLVIVAGCSHTPPDLSAVETSGAQQWIEEVINYQYNLPTEHDDQIWHQLEISAQMRQEVHERFGGMSRHGAAEGIVYWLLDKEYGRGMQYDVTANLTPIEAFEQRRGNCLSFTMLLTALAAELNINIDFNAVDIPDTWGMDEEVGMVFFRHVNGVLKTPRTRQVFDLAMDIYDSGYPQRFITRDQAMALMHNNRAIDYLRANDLAQSVHLLKLGISLSPKNSDMWANLGVIMKRLGQFNRAETAFLKAYELDRNHVPAISNLERFYREQGDNGRAKAFLRQAERARKSNPYYHYNLALEHYVDDSFRHAMRYTKKAILLHDKDPRFFELKSLISEQMGRYDRALLALEKAYHLASSTEQRGKYLNQVQDITQRAIEASERARRLRQREIQDMQEIQRELIIN